MTLNNKENDDKIDFIIPWVDGNDINWQKVLSKYKDNSGDKRASRFRDWDNLQYIFRGIEEFTPWVNKVYFITYGHLPKWLNTAHEKLVIVKHEDFMDKKNLPIFNSHPIEVNLHRIKGLSEKFVYFNDDTFILKKINRDVFFKNNLPVNVAISSIVRRTTIPYIVINNLEIINKHFNKKIDKKYKKQNIVINNFFKWFYPGYGFKSISTLLLLYWSEFTGFVNYHQPQPFLKSTFEDVWEKEKELLDKVSKSKFRLSTDVNQYLFKYWQFVTGRFYPDKYKNAYVNRKYMNIKTNTDSLVVAKIIESKKLEMICTNDFIDKDSADTNFEFIKKNINDALKNILPNKSSFEIH
jgi:hypothetical protein